MARTFAIALCLLCAVSAVAASGRNLNVFSGATTSTCEANADLSMTVLWGSCRGRAKATCEASAVEENIVKKESKALIGELCVEASVTSRIWAMSQAIANAATSALVNVKCDGLGFGCGWAAAKGTAWAQTWINIIVEASALVFDPETTDVAMCWADLRVTGAAIAEALSESQANACVKGNGGERAFRKDFAEAISKLLVDAWAKATVFLCNDGTDAEAISQCDVFGNIKDKNTETTGTPNDNSTPGGSTGGNTETGAGKVSPCLGVGMGACCSAPCPGVIPFSSTPEFGKLLAYDGGKLCSCPVDADGPFPKAGK